MQGEPGFQERSGSPQRLDRDLSGRYGSASYALEELRAEISSAIVGAEMGLPCDIPNHASYLAYWLERLRSDKREIFRAAADAQKIADYLLQFHPDFAAQDSAPETDRAEDTEAEPQAA